MLQRCHVPEQRFRQREEIVILDVDCGNVRCSWEGKRVVVQAVEVAFLNVPAHGSHGSMRGGVVDAVGRRCKWLDEDNGGTAEARCTNAISSVQHAVATTLQHSNHHKCPWGGHTNRGSVSKAQIG